ncbi:hypothetical protein COLO4_36992 [Corchorus olitorius]|uniref:Uncharacterized protein n=1 Tax=Corchorus olitorius TaxID=93759 RepID=A0A1R3G3V7_9ROSI|nr:hypothetical protein COLO4_36992 [Corchorus olitorius]
MVVHGPSQIAQLLGAIMESSGFTDVESSMGRHGVLLVM